MSTEASSTVTLPFSSLYLSPLNVRIETDDPELPELIASIKAQGVLHNLIVHPEQHESKKPRKQHPSRYGVVSGGRRWRALLALHEQGSIGDDHPVDCKVCTYQDAVEISLAANMFRRMHPADQFIAFKKLIDAGRSVEEVAARFGVTPLVIHRRLRLANLDPMFISLYRDGVVTLDHLMALAVTDDHKRQQEVWETSGGEHCRPEALRRALIDAETSSEAAIAKFVGLDVYVAAGGIARSDLFADVGESYLLDRPLLEKLAKEKLEGCAAQLKADGAVWVDIFQIGEHWRRGDYTRVAMQERSPTEAEQAREEALHDEIHNLEWQLDDDPDNDELYEQCQARQQELDSLREARMVPDAEQMKLAGTLLSIQQDGSLLEESGYLRAEDAKRSALATKRARANDGNREAKTGIPAALTANLLAHRTAALQVEVARRPQLALTALLHCLIRERFFRCASFGSAVRITCEELSLRRFAEDIEASPAFSVQEKSLEALRAQLPESPDLLWDWLRARSVDELLTTLAICVAPTIDGTIHGSRQNSDFDDLARAAELDMRRWWSVTPGFLSRVQKRQILDAVREGVSAEAAVPLEPLKKEALVEAAQRQLDGSGWLPLPLRVG